MIDYKYNDPRNIKEFTIPNGVTKIIYSFVIFDKMKREIHLHSSF